MKPPTVFFTSDTHFQHAKVIEFSKRPYASIEEMNAAMIRNWREAVTDEDVVYHLGDFAWKWNAETKGILTQLPGTKHLIVGNHDHSQARKAKDWSTVQDYRELAVTRPDGTEVLLVMCHYPFAVWKNSHHGSVNLHGHSHGTYPANSQQMDVGVDCVGYRPIGISEVFERLAAFTLLVHQDGHRALQLP